MAIIKCPECGHEVSDRAAHCPFCGVDIAGNLLTCPDCGKILLKGTRVCPNCGCDLSNTAPAPMPLRQATPKTPPKAQPAPQAESQKGKAWIIAIVIVAVLAIGIGGYLYMQHRNAQQDMEQAYAALDHETDPAAYQAFLDQYPNSEHAKDVKDRLAELQKARDRWTEISLSSSKADFLRYLEEFPGSVYEQACKDKIDSLDWIDASTENTQASYQAYISMHPDGKYLDIANKSKADLDKLTVTYDERSAVRNIIARYFESISSNDADGLSQIVVDKMYDQSVQFMNKLHEGANQTQFVVNSRVNISKAPATTGDQMNFVAKFTVNKQVLAGAETTNTLYKASTILSPDMRIITMRLNKEPQTE